MHKTNIIDNHITQMCLNLNIPKIVKYNAQLQPGSSSGAIKLSHSLFQDNWLFWKSNSKGFKIASAVKLIC